MAEIESLRMVQTDLEGERETNSQLRREIAILRSQLEEQKLESKSHHLSTTNNQSIQTEDLASDSSAKSALSSSSSKVAPPCTKEACCQASLPQVSSRSVELKIQRLEDHLKQRESYFSTAVQQVKVSAQLEKQILIDSFQKVRRQPAYFIYFPLSHMNRKFSKEMGGCANSKVN